MFETFGHVAQTPYNVAVLNQGQLEQLVLGEGLGCDVQVVDASCTPQRVEDKRETTHGVFCSGKSLDNGQYLYYSSNKSTSALLLVRLASLPNKICIH